LNLQIEYQACPLCKGIGASIGTADCTRHPLWHDPLPRFLEWMRCTNCNHVYTRYYWSEEGLKEVFAKANAHQLVGGEPDTKRTIWAPVVERSLRALGGYRSTMNKEHSPVWIDVGCGDGALIMTAADFGFHAIGLDARADAVARIQALGFSSQQVDFMDLLLDKDVDVISMMDVLEHIPYPTRALEKANKLLRHGGLLVISLPDLASSTWRIMDAMKINPYWMEIEHHHNFSRSLLIILLEAAGFAVVDFAIPYRYKAQMEIYAVKVAV
jgi:2-polyprenyl-3-methyl-5-hydroxy-6-metoxy-1,4-benzoquinol methylase